MREGASVCSFLSRNVGMSWGGERESASERKGAAESMIKILHTHTSSLVAG